MRSALLAIDDMHCSACVARLNRALADSTIQVRPSVATRTAEVRWKAGIDADRILQRVRDAGFSARWLDGHPDPELTATTQQESDRRQMTRMAVATLMTMQVMMLAVPSYFGEVEAGLDQLLRYAQWLVATPVVLYAGAPFLVGAARALQTRQPNMDLPVGIAIALAYVASVLNVLRGSGELYFESAAMFVTLLSIGRWFEGRGRARAAARLKELLSLQQSRARVRRQGTWIDVDVRQVISGDEIEICPGDAVPVDGTLLSDSAPVSLSVITGESAPVTLVKGDAVPSGSVHVGAQALRILATDVGQASTLSRIAALSHQALGQRTRTAQMADRYAGVFILCVLALSALAFLFWMGDGVDRAFATALAVLVASCPCALSLATPSAIAAASGRLAKHGVLVRDPDGLLRARKVDALILDKTGTLTRDRLELRSVRTGVELDDLTACRIAAAIESCSRHPVARAFDHFDPLPVRDVESLADEVRGYYLDRECSLRALDLDSAQCLGADIDDGTTWIGLYLEGNPQAQAAFSLEATITATPETLEALRPHEPELLSGDADHATRRLARRLGIQLWHARQTPAQKLERIRQLRSNARTVMAVGDGANDAALLAAADVAVAMGHGAALSQSAADMVLLRGDISSLPEIMVESRRVQSRISQNLSWALAYNLSIFPLAFFGVVTPWLAALGMSASSLIVVTNALRGERHG